MSYPQICVEDRPVCIFATGQRTGSTLTQLLLNSHPDLRVWSEHEGALNQLTQLHERVLLALQPRHWGRFDIPKLVSARDAERAFLHIYFGVPALAAGKPRWGFKEVRYGRDVADLLLDLFPAASIIHLTRHPIDAFISMKRREEAPEPWHREWSLEALRNWERINLGFLGAPHPRVLLLKYEELVADSEECIQRIATFAGFDPSGINRAIFDRRVALEAGGSYGSRRPIPRSSLSDEERELLTTPGIRDACSRLGYELTFAP